MRSTWTTFFKDRQNVWMFCIVRGAPSLLLRICGRQPIGLRVLPGSHTTMNRKRAGKRLAAIESCSSRLIAVPPSSVIIMRSDLVYAELGSMDNERLFNGYPLTPTRTLRDGDELFRLFNGKKMNFHFHCLLLRSDGWQ